MNKPLKDCAQIRNGLFFVVYRHLSIPISCGQRYHLPATAPLLTFSGTWQPGFYQHPMNLWALFFLTSKPHDHLDLCVHSINPAFRFIVFLEFVVFIELPSGKSIKSSTRTCSSTQLTQETKKLNEHHLLVSWEAGKPGSWEAAHSLPLTAYSSPTTPVSPSNPPTLFSPLRIHKRLELQGQITHGLRLGVFGIILPTTFI